jgi:hypothetical protein
MILRAHDALPSRDPVPVVVIIIPLFISATFRLSTFLGERAKTIWDEK